MVGGVKQKRRVRVRALRSGSATGSQSFDGLSGAEEKYTGRLKELKSNLSTVRKRESRLIRRLGQRALEVLIEGGSLDHRDPEAQAIVTEVQELRRKDSLLAQKVNSLQIPYVVGKKAMPSEPGTDSLFPFSR
jgi:hypothetical protein